MRQILILLLVAMAMLIGLFIFFRYPSHTAYPVRGLDVSHHQGRITWGAVPTEVVDFVFIKATEGGDFNDREFHRNWPGAKEVGIARGAYHFFTFCTPGALQAEHFLTTVGPDFGELPPAVDVEYGGNCSQRLTDRELRQELNDFYEVITEAWGVEPLIYVTRDIYHDYPLAFSGKPVWGRAIMTPPSREYGKDWTFWQFSFFGQVAGIAGRVDQNVFKGSHSTFENWLMKSE